MQAARLAIRLPEADAAQSRDILAWVAQSPAHAVAFARAESAWKDAERLKALGPELPDTVHAQHDTPNDRWDVPVETRAGASGLSRRRMLVAASAIAVLAGIWPVWRLLHADKQAFATERGEVRRVRLEDGSILHLDTDSRVLVAFSKERRAFWLERGAASFDVAHDATRPFDVMAGGSMTRAIGTRFTVDARGLLDGEKGPVEVTVSEGIVSVSDSDGREVRLAAGHGAKITPGALATQTLDAQTMEQRTAWEQHMLVLDGMSLRQAAAAFSRYRAKPILVDDPALADMRMGGRFGLEESDQFLSALESGFGVTVKRDRDGTVHLSEQH